MLLKKFLILILAFASSSIFSCAKKDNYSDKISQLRTDVFEYDCEDYSLTAYVENIETPTDLDGIVGKKENQMVFKLKTKSTDKNYENSSIKFCIGENTYFKRFDFKQITSLLACTVQVVSFPKENLLVTLNLNGKEEQLAMTSVKNPTTKEWKKALDELAKSKDFLELISKEKTEIKVRLIDNDGYDYWYVGVIDQEKTTSYLLDGENLELIAKKDG